MVHVQQASVCCAVNNFIEVVGLRGRGHVALLHSLKGDVAGIEGGAALGGAWEHGKGGMEGEGALQNLKNKGSGDTEKRKVCVCV